TDQFALLVANRRHMLCRKMKVRPVEVADHYCWIEQAEPPDNLLPDRRRGCGGEGQAARRADRVGLRAEQQVIGTEVAPPLADEVRFINGEEPRPGALQRVSGLVVSQLLGRGGGERAG